MPTISVIVPVYRAEGFLHTCLDSILSQTFRDFEVLLVDDGSPDRSGEICDDYAAKDARIRVIHQENRGQADARNHGLTLAQGQWICYIDSDDAVHPQLLELLYQAAVEGDCPISMCAMLEAEELPEDFSQPKQLQYEILSMAEESLVSLYDADRYPGWVACAKLIRRDIVEGYPFTQGRIYEDNEAVCRWICRGQRLAQLPYSLYFYRSNPQSTTQSAYSVKKLDYLWALESILSYYRQIGYGRMAQRFFDRYVEAVVSACNGLQYELHRRDLAKQVERNCRRFAREEKLSLSRRQWELLLDTMHPRLAGLYWPAAGVGKRLSKIMRKGKET